MTIPAGLETGRATMTAYDDNRGARGFIAQLKAYGPFRAGDGVIFGVAKGLADYFGWSVGLVRLILIISTIFLFFWPTIILYLVAALIMSPTPQEKLNTPEERDIWLQAQLDPEAAMDGLSRRAERMEKRMRRLEDFVTSKEYAWSRRMNTPRP
ncbi:envelope stress response membrane protein PspC [Deltaproteobacteria bacterium Smac51]|nr:envelope stress response membrane protein PspC [Deltaproteobacteria bacterium Smac51]